MTMSAIMDGCLPSYENLRWVFALLPSHLHHSGIAEDRGCVLFVEHVGSCRPGGGHDVNSLHQPICHICCHQDTRLPQQEINFPCPLSACAYGSKRVKYVIMAAVLCSPWTSSNARSCHSGTRDASAAEELVEVIRYAMQLGAAHMFTSRNLHL